MSSKSGQTSSWQSWSASKCFPLAVCLENKEGAAEAADWSLLSLFEEKKEVLTKGEREREQMTEWNRLGRNKEHYFGQRQQQQQLQKAAKDICRPGEAEWICWICRRPLAFLFSLFLYLSSARHLAGLKGSHTVCLETDASSQAGGTRQIKKSFLPLGRHTKDTGDTVTSEQKKK